MLNSSVTSKGQVTIPVTLREKLGLKPGDKVAFVEKAGEVVLQRVENRVESVFGLFKASKGGSLEGIDSAVNEARSRRVRR